MARNDVFLNINALSPADAVVTGQQDMTAATVPELVLGDTPTFNFYFTDNTNVWPSWAGNAAYTLTWALSDAVAGDFAPAATTGNATPITGGWSVILPLNSYDLVGLLNTKRVGQPYPVQNLWQQLRVTDPSGNEVTRAMFWTPVRYRAISDTQNTESASPTGGRFVTVNNVNTLTTPTAAQFYAANPVPTSALGTAANGELLIGNGTGFTKATLTAGSGVSITNGSGSITISATDGDITLDDGTAAAPSLKFTADTDTGIYRPSDNVVGISAGGVSRATFGATSAINGTTIPGSKTLVVTTDKLSALAATTSAELAGVISDETGSGALVFANTPTLVTPNIGAATGTSVNLSGAGTFGGNLTVSGSTSIGSVFNMDAGNSTGTRTLQFGSTFNSGTFNFQNGLTTVMAITSGRVHFPATARTDDGGPTVPGWGFINDSGMGLYRVSANNLGFAINNANAATLNTTGLSLTGNLTVSGTGTSSVAGNLFVGTTTAAASGARLQAQLTGTDGTVSTLLSLRKNTNAIGTGVAIDFTPDSTDNPLAKLSAVRTSLVFGYTDFRFSTWNGSAFTEQLRLVGQTGNLLIGTTTDTGEKLQVNGTGYFAGSLIQLGNGTVDAIYRVTASNGKSSEFGDDTTGGFVRANNSQSLRFITGGTTALTLDTSQNATFAGNVRAGTVVGTAKTVIIDAAFTTLLNVTKTFTVTMPSPSLASSFVLEVGVYGNTATGYASLMVKGGGYLGSSTLYEATELTKINSGSVTISSVTKASGSMTFTVINTSSSGHVAICYKQTSDDVFTTLPTITAV